MTGAEHKNEDAMTDATADPAEGRKKSGTAGMIVGGVLAILGAAGGYYATVSGLLPTGHTTDGAPSEKHAETPAANDHSGASPTAVGFVDLPPVIVSVNTADARHLKFHAQLEVNASHLAEVEEMKPRIMDVMNGYLRAIDLSDLQDSLALMRIRGHLLRRIGIVVGEGRVRDVLVMEFVLN